MITFSGIGSVQIDNPEPGYTARVHLAMSPQRTDAGWEIWDNGISYDYRDCEIPRFILDDSDAEDLRTFIENNRGDTVTMTLSSDSGFFPFGPDLGDTGVFTVVILSCVFGDLDQFHQYPIEMKLLMVSSPAYTPPATIEQGNFQIGTVDGLLYPQLGFVVNKVYGLQHGVSYGGDPSNVDIGVDIYEVEFVQQCNESLAAELVAYLSGATGRENDINIIADTDYYMYGVENGDSGTYSSKLISNIIECRHIEYEQFEIPLAFSLLEVV